jgi:hypothetical protein
MINKDELKIGDTIWQVDFNGSDVTLRKIQIDYLHHIAGKYWVSCEQEGSMEGVMLKVDSHLLFHTKKEALDYMSALWYSLKEVLTNETE